MNHCAEALYFEEEFVLLVPNACKDLSVWLKERNNIIHWLNTLAERREKFQGSTSVCLIKSITFTEKKKPSEQRKIDDHCRSLALWLCSGFFSS